MFLLLTSGFGVYVTLAGAHPAHGIFDLDLAESSTFFTSLFPGGSLVLLLMVVYLRALYEGVVTHRSWPACGIGACAVGLLSTIHPEKVAVLAAGTALYFAWLAGVRGRSFRVLLAPALMSALMLGAAVPYAVYTVTSLTPDPVLAALLLRGHLHPPVADPFFYVFGYGLPGLLALAALPRFVKRARGSGASEGEAVLWSMLAAGLLLLFTPGALLDHRGEGVQLLVAPLPRSGWCASWCRGPGAALPARPRGGTAAGPSA